MTDFEEKPLKPWKYTKLIAERPKTMFGATIALPCTLFIVFVILLVFGQFAISTDVILEDREDVNWQRGTGLLLAQEEVTKTAGDQPRQSVATLGILVIFQSNSGNVFTEERILQIKKVQDDLLSVPEYKDFCFTGLTDGQECQPPNSFLNYFFPEPNDCNVVNCTAEGNWNYNGKGTTMRPIEETLANMASMEGPFAMAGNFFDKSFTPNNLESRLTQIQINLASPLAGFSNNKDRELDQRAKQDKFVVDKWGPILRSSRSDLRNSMKVLWIGQGITDAEYNAAFGNDILLVVASIVFIGVYLYFQFKSLFLVAIGLCEVLIAYPISMFIYQYVFQYRHIGVLHILALYIILGVGVDNLFVYYDCWKLSKFAKGDVNLSYANRVHYVWHKSSKAMLVTTLTTFVAFAATAVTPFVSIQTFGIFCALTIIIQYLLVITVWPAAVVIYDMNWGHYSRCGCWPCCNENKLSDIELQTNDEPKETKEAKPRLEQLFSNHIAPFVTQKYVKIAILALSFAYVIVCAAFASQIEPEETQSQFFRKGHPLRDAFDAQQEFATKTDEFTIEVNVVWGVKGVDTSKGDPENEEKLGAVIWDDTFDVTVAGAQQAISTVCSTALTRIETLGVRPNTQAKCVIDTFYEWLDQDKNITTIIEGQTFFTYFSEFMDTFPYSNTFAPNVGIQNGRVRFISVDFQTDLPAEESFSTGNKWRNNWNDFMDEMNQNAPPTANNGYATTPLWIWYHTLEQLFIQSWWAIFASILISYAILMIFLMNPILASYAMFIIVCIVVCVLGTMVMMGWQFGLVQTVGCIMVVGLSVDYTVHISHSYLDAGVPDRFNRTKHSLSTLGVSVVGGALSTMGSVFILLFTQIIYLSQYGIVILLLIFYSFVFSLTFYPAMCATIGPQGDLGNLWVVYNKALKWWEERKN